MKRKLITIVLKTIIGVEVLGLSIGIIIALIYLYRVIANPY